MPYQDHTDDDHGTEQRQAHGHGHGDLSRSEGAPRGPLTRLWARLRHAVTPHGHDSTERIDSALEISERGMRTLLWSFAVLSVTAVAQLAIVLFTGSVALPGDTIHNFADALTALPIGAAVVHIEPATGAQAAHRTLTHHI